MLFHWLQPLTAFRDLDDAIASPSWRLNPTTSAPAVNLYRTEDAVRIDLRLPGFAPEEIDVRVDGDQLTVKGATEDLKLQGEMLRRERSHQSFERNIQMPFRVDADSIDATFENGILTIRAAMHESEKPRVIPVKAIS